MKQPVDYIATWFYKESDQEASFYPQMGEKGNSALVHSIYMQIQIPFFITFHHYNPKAHFLFFTNLQAGDLPPYLQRLFKKLNVEVISKPYTSRPPKGWYAAWQNQFYVYDILKEMENRMQTDDCLLISDADCLCRTPLDSLFEQTRRDGSALYEFITDKDYVINGITLPQMNKFYKACYNQEPQKPITYYGGEFIALRQDAIKKINAEFPVMWNFNLKYAQTGQPKLNEEAHVMSILAERLQLRNRTANQYVKRMWTNPQYNNVRMGDENYPVWHMPYEKKRGLYYLYQMLEKDMAITNETEFWKKASFYNGIPTIGWRKKAKDFITAILLKMKH